MDELHREGYQICSLFGYKDCSFRLSASTAANVLQHIESCHPSKTVVENAITWNLPLEISIMDEGSSHQFVNSIVQVPNTDKHVLLIIEVTKPYLSIYFVDLTLSLSRKDNVSATVSIPDEEDPFLSWDFSLACGLDSWRYLVEKNCAKSVEIGMPSLLQHCDEKGELGVCVRIK